MTGFTKGPWRVDQGAVLGDDGVDGDRMVASCTGYTRNYDAEMVLGQNANNANLIAAAPDMYEALKAAYSTIKHLDEHLHGICREEDTDGVKIQEAYAVIRAALAKADGK